MPIDFKLPDLGENIESGDVVSVLVHEGDVIAADQEVVELETDKATVAVPCPHAGRVAKIHVREGQMVAIGETVLTLEQVDAETAPTTPEAPRPAAEAPPATSPEEAPELAASAASTGGKTDGGGPAAAAVAEAAATTTTELPVAAGPATRRLARELGVNLRRVTGTGNGGRITREDVVRAVRESNRAPAAQQVAPAKPGEPDREAQRDDYGVVRRERMSRTRRTIAANMVRSATTIPHLTNFDDADITELEALRKGSMADYAGTDVKLTMLAFVIKAVAMALKHHPLVNASLDDESEEIVYKEYVNVGVAVDTERGLMVPVLRDTDQSGIPQIARQLAAIAQKARAGKIAMEDLRGGTFTISNLGSVGGIYSTPIINHPEVAILLTGRSRKLPQVVADDRIEPRLLMPVSLSYDHRIIDGATAARFLNDVIDYLETPGRLLLAP